MDGWLPEAGSNVRSYRYAIAQAVPTSSQRPAVKQLTSSSPACLKYRPREFDASKLGQALARVQIQHAGTVFEIKIPGALPEQRVQAHELAVPGQRVLR